MPTTGTHPELLERLRQISAEAASADPAHDAMHSRRVLLNALEIAAKEGGDVEILSAAAYLHDIANLPKDHPESRFSSERSARKAEEIVRGLGFDEAKMPALMDAILCHSFSRGLQPKTLEGRIFQDADRLDALGAIGIARTFTVGGATARKLYATEDPFCEDNRQPNDQDNTLDHFYVKLLKLGEKMQTPTGQHLAQERLGRMHGFLRDLQDEVSP